MRHLLRELAATTRYSIADSTITVGEPTPLDNRPPWLQESEREIAELLSTSAPSSSTKAPTLLRPEGMIRGPHSTINWKDVSAVSESSRKITNSGQMKVIGFVHSFTTGSLIPVESVLEAEATILFDHAPAVKHLQSQPCRLPYKLFGTSRHTTPDLLVEAGSRKLYVEVKPYRIASRPESIAKYEAIAIGAATQQARYYVITERTIRAQPRLQQVRALRRHALHPIALDKAEALLRQIPHMPDHIELGALKSLTGSRCIELQAVLAALAYWDRVRIQGFPLRPQSLISQTKENSQ